MKTNQAINHSHLNQAEPTNATCPMWKKAVAGVLVVAAVALALSATIWFSPPSSSSIEALKGLAVIVGTSIGLVAAGIALVTALLWIISRSVSIMSRGRAVVAYITNCYPQQIKDRILSH